MFFSQLCTLNDKYEEDFLVKADHYLAGLSSGASDRISVSRFAGAIGCSFQDAERFFKDSTDIGLMDRSFVFHCPECGHLVRRVKQLNELHGQCLICPRCDAEIGIDTFDRAELLENTELQYSILKEVINAMRVILFRGKRIDNGEWVTGGYYCDDYSESVSITFWNSFGLGFMDSCRVDPKTVGQFTGLNDKNGKRIFEGDIVKRFWLGSEIIYRIKYEEGNACFIGEALNKSGFTTFDHDGEMFEVIGNIYDNTEFLKGGNEK